MAPAISAAAPAGGGATAASSAPDARLPTALELPAGPHEYQTWNNCGPATVSMAMGRVAQAPGQAAAARELKPDPEDKNVSPDEMAEYVRRKGLGAIVRVDGTLDGLRRLLAVGVPVIVETWFVPEPGDEMGHYRVLVGYDEEAGGFLADDSYNGPGIVLPFDRFDEAWRVFNRVYVVVFPRSLEREIRAVLGDDDERQMYLGAVRTAQAEIVRRPDAFGYFNLGSSLLGLGDAAGAADAYDRARAFGLPWRMLWYQFGPFEAYGAIGRWADVAGLAETNLHNAPNLEESHYWLGRSLLAQGDADGAALHWREAMRLNPLHVEAAAALSDLEGR